MALKINDVEITEVYYNGIEKMVLQYNGVCYFGKKFSFVKKETTGVAISVSRVSSPNQRAEGGTIDPGEGIYYGDTLTMSAVADKGYVEPKLYVDLGDGNGHVLRTSPFTFIVNNDISFYGTAMPDESQDNILWAGSQEFISAGSLPVVGISSAGQVKVTCTIAFENYLYDPYMDSWSIDILSSKKYIERELPLSVSSNGASARLSVKGDAVYVECQSYESSYKGFISIIMPHITITEVRR